MRRMIAAGPLAKRPPHIAFAGPLAWFGIVALVLLLVVPTVAVLADEDIKLGEFIAVTPPQPAPHAAFTDAGGNSASLAGFAGQPTVINLWATWCQPCLRELPSLDRLQAAMGDRLRVVEVSEDHAGAKIVNPFVAAMKLGNLHVYLDPEANLGHAFKVLGLPTSIVLDRQGRVVGKVEGPTAWDSPNMAAILAPFLSAGPPPMTHASAGLVN